MLFLAKLSSVFYKNGGKKDLIIIDSLCNSKVIFTLLAEVITFYLGLTTIYVQSLSFDGHFSEVIKY